MAKKFVHLHVHTEYSLLDGLSKISLLAEHVKKQGMDAVAITDHGTMYGAVEFYKKVKEFDIKPIIGMEGYISNGPHREKPKRGKGKNYHLLLLAKNYTGYKNLMKLTSIAHLEGYYYRPRVDKDTLKRYASGLICTSACPQGELAQLLIEENYKEAKKLTEWFYDVFADDYYFEIQRHNYKKFASDAVNEEIKRELLQMAENSKKIEEGTFKLSRELGIPVVATNDCHYIKKEDAEAQDALLCIATGKNISDTKRLRFIDTPDFYVKSPEEMAKEFTDIPEALENSLKIAEKCNVELEIGKWYFPKVELPKSVTAEEHLVNETRLGLKVRYEKITKEIEDRLEYELGVITDKGYAPYFLIFQDMANWAREKKIPINTRGSAAGSLVSYCLGITSVDPIKYLLPFERFLNPFRPSAPDIDLDISDDKREEMIGYLTEKYGNKKVAQICTFGRMLAKGSVRDIARVLGYDYATGDRISKKIPLGSQGFPMTIDLALTENRELNELYEADKDAKKIIDLAKQIEGNARHVSVHAAGVVISPMEITEFTPVQKEPSGEKIITQYDMWSCEDVGLVKLDVLGIRNLSILRESVEWVRRTKGSEIRLESIPLDDEKTFVLLSKGETMGTFQLSGSGMTRYLVELEPERIEDIMAMIALFRPGPMANIPEYIARKKGKKNIEYYHPKMESYLDKSYGILVYQDDLLFTALEVAGYDWKQVDKFRKAVGKKIPSEMKKQHEIFVQGCMKHSGMTKKEAEGLWELFEPFQGYGFNKAHAASYGLVAYQTAYMKANYPVEFMCALLTAESGDSVKVSAAVNECKRINIKVLPPDINESDVGFKIVEDEESLEGLAIRFGLGAIKHAGVAAINSILTARKDGRFISFSDFLSRVDNRKVNKKVIESLIKVGALGEFGKRAALLSSMEDVRNSVVKHTRNVNQQGLFSSDDIKNTMKSGDLIDDSVDEFSDEELQSLERELLGFSLSARPLFELIEPFIFAASHKVYEISPKATIDQRVKVACVVSDVRIIVTKRSGKEMAFVQVEDDTGTIELVVFPGVFDKTRDAWIDNNVLLVDGKVDDRDESASIIVEEVLSTDDLAQSDNRLYIRIPPSAEVEHLRELKNFWLKIKGTARLALFLREKTTKRSIFRFG